MKKTILFIDDEQYYQDVYGKVLEAEYELTYSKNGEDALQKISDTNFDLIVLDLVMPIMSGKKLIEEIGKNSKSKLIVLTTLEGDTDRQDALENGADFFLVKNDTNPQELLKNVKKLID
ncbi:response regulator [Candidatus Dojkabacteria bacterium]|nr:response regulator [Candidatus Dojkabacteria bacterium]